MISVTDNAINRIFEVSKKQKIKKDFFRVSISGGGCQGFQYNFNFENKVNEDDQVFEFKNIKILVDNTSLEILSGCKIDFILSAISSQIGVLLLLILK